MNFSHNIPFQLLKLTLGLALIGCTSGATKRPASGDNTSTDKTDAGADADTDADTDVDADADSDGDSDSDSDSDADGDSDSDSDSDADGDSDGDTDSDTDGDSDTDTDSDSDVASVCDGTPVHSYIQYETDTAGFPTSLCSPNADTWMAQTFEVLTSTPLNGFAIALFEKADDMYDLGEHTIYLKHEDAIQYLGGASVQVDPGVITSFCFDASAENITLEPGNTYSLELEPADDVSDEHVLCWLADRSVPYTAGYNWVSFDGGSSWTSLYNHDATQDATMYFEVY